MTGRRAVSNPIAGFSIIIPDDWEMATGALGNVEIAIDAPSGVGLLGQPALTFFHAPRPPQPQAEELVAALRLLGVEARARRTDRSDEWEVTGVYRHHLLGDLQTRWLCRQERGRSYVVAVAVRAADEEAFREDIAVALRSCRLIPTPILRFFEEPTERAYRIVLPHGWQWREARILRTADIPGYFTWKAQSADGLVGCFTAPPGVFNVTQEYVPAETMARGLVLGELRKLIPDLRTEKVQVLHRANDYFLAGLRLLGGPMSRPRFDKVRADYVGTAGGKPVRLRVTVTTLMFGSSPLLEGRGNWLLFTHGVWAPVEGFDQLAPLAQGVQVSHWTSPEWVKKQREAVDKVLVERHSVMDRVVADWNAYVRDRDRVRDPDGGPIQEVPNRDGHVWKDPEGVMWLVPPVYEMETWVRNRGWKYIR